MSKFRYFPVHNSVIYPVDDAQRLVNTRFKGSETYKSAISGLPPIARGLTGPSLPVNLRQSKPIIPATLP